MESIAYFLTDELGIVQELGGRLEAFGLEEVAPGDDLTLRIDMLHGLLPLLEKGAEHLPRVELVPGRYADIQLGRGDRGAVLVLRDATGDAERERHYQQRGNELALMLRSMGVAVFEALEDDTFQRVGLMPSWLRTLCGEDFSGADLLDRLPFLESFLDDAREAWDADGMAVSGMWTEEDESGKEHHLEASALRADAGRPLLVVQSQERRYEERRHILQGARDKSLDFDRLRREIDKKEVLLHCIVHDLKGPLSGMVGTMSLVQGRELGQDQVRELLTIGLEQARHQEAMIKSLLDTFSAEVSALQHFETSAELAPSLLQCVEEARDTYRHAYEQNQVGLEIDAAGVTRKDKVVGESSRLVRVLCNLLENALRHSPANKTVTIRVRREDGRLRVSVDDQGAGVPEELREYLFLKFSQGKLRGGAAGLGLYFCRSTVEMWGGEIGYELTPESGSSFSFALPEAT